MSQNEKSIIFTRLVLKTNGRFYSAIINPKINVVETKSLKEQSTEQLLKSKKAHSVIIIIESLLILAFLVYFLYVYLTATWTYSLVIVIMPTVLLAGMIPAFIMRQAIVKELDSRK